ncbi:MAG: 2-hydroxycyclohexanecarboxyl-CoA dehydrogenase [Candidatus Rokubacteria bacterium RIFCSPLOWO2_12_FULL_71_19]|nr:MAG: 2-hydroxycyclohexanecarboxyl-CoA dehydrogenase [Candidatus Rokubacteria bacterium RIFCSPLOWO2_12_FULL_71_19]
MNGSTTLRGKAALVTGAGRGIGRAIALSLAQAGAQVAVLDILADNAESVRREVEAWGVKGLAVAVDLTRRAEVERAVGEVVAQFGQLDIVVNNAGWDKMEMFLDTEEETWDKIIAINFKSVLHVCKAALPHLVKRGSGRVISIASDAGRVGSTGESVYSGTKGAIIAFSKTLAREMARYQVTVNVVCPGLTETPLLQGIREQSEKPARVIEAVPRAIPLGRVGQPEDIAGAVAFLASPAAGFVTGQTLSVSGGLTMA